MARRGSKFAGLSVAIVTPFVDGKLCVDTLKQQIEFQIDAGTTCIVPCGTTGESPTLSHPCLLYTSPSPRDRTRSRMPSSA